MAKNKSVLLVLVAFFALTVIAVPTHAYDWNVSTNATGSYESVGYDSGKYRVAQTMLISDALNLSSYSFRVTSIAGTGGGVCNLNITNHATKAPIHQTTMTLNSAGSKNVSFAPIQINAGTTLFFSIVCPSPGGTTTNYANIQGQTTSSYPDGDSYRSVATSETWVINGGGIFDYFWVVNGSRGGPVAPGANLTINSQTYSGLRLLDFNATASNGSTVHAQSSSGQLVFPINDSTYNVSAYTVTNNTYINVSYQDVAGDSTQTLEYAVLNITAQTLIPMSNLSNYTVRMIHRDTDYVLSNMTTENVSLFYVNPGNYSLFFEKKGYISKAYNLTLFNGVTSFKVNTSADNAVSLLFMDEITSVLQAGIVFDIINDAFSQRVSMGVNTSILLQSIPYGDYEFRYGLSNTSLQPRSFYISFPISVSNLTNITLRTINTSVSTLFIRNIVDATSQPMTGYVLDVQRFYTNGSGSTGAWETVVQTEIDQRGDAVFPAVPNTQAYRFRIVNGTSIIDTFSPSYLVDQSSNFISKGSGGVLSNFNTAQGIAYTSIRNTTSQLVFDYSSVAEISRICMDVLYEYRFNSSRVQACSNANSGTLASSIDANQNGTYTATVYANISGEIYTLDTIKFKPTGTNPRATFGKYGLIIWLVSMLVAAIIGGFVNPIPGLVFAVTATLAYAASFIGLISMSVTIAGGLLITVIIVLILFARRE